MTSMYFRLQVRSTLLWSSCWLLLSSTLLFPACGGDSGTAGLSDQGTVLDSSDDQSDMGADVDPEDTGADQDDGSTADAPDGTTSDGSEDVSSDPSSDTTEDTGEDRGRDVTSEDTATIDIAADITDESDFIFGSDPDFGPGDASDDSDRSVPDFFFDADAAIPDADITIITCDEEPPPDGDVAAIVISGNIFNNRGSDFTTGDLYLFIDDDNPRLAPILLTEYYEGLRPTDWGTAGNTLPYELCAYFERDLTGFMSAFFDRPPMNGPSAPGDEDLEGFLPSRAFTVPFEGSGEELSGINIELAEI